MKDILVLIPTDTETRRRLEEAAPGCRFTYASAQELPKAAVRRASIVLGNLPVPLLPQAQSLEWLQLNSAGADSYVQPGVLPAGVRLTNATGAYGPAVAEHMLAMTLSLMKKLPLYRDNQRASLWRDEGPVIGIPGSVFLIVGLGDIGSTYARSVSALGGRVLGIRRHLADKPDYVERLFSMEELDEALPLADVVALALPGNAQTAGLFSADRLNRMKPGAFLLNVGRGSAVDAEALCEALIAGRLAGAGLDVTDPEPLPADHRLWSLPNALITPHVSGWYHMKETGRRIAAICCRNLRHYLAGEELENQVDFATGARRYPGGS